MNQHHETHHHTYKHPWPFLRDIEKLGDDYLIRRAPRQIPHKWKEFVVKILPVLTLIVAIISLPGILISVMYLLGIGTHNVFRTPYGGWGAAYPMILIQTLITALIAGLYFKAFDRLRKRQYAGWVYVFYAGLLGFVANLLDGGILWALIGFIVSMYLLFQAKELYH